MKRVSLAVLLVLSVMALASVGCTATPPAQGFSGVTVDGDMLVVGTVDGKVMGLSPSARAANAPFPTEDEWSYSVMTERRGSFGCGTSQASSVLYSNPIVTEGHVCIATYDGKVLMLDPDSRATGMAFPQVRAGEWQFPRTDDKIGPVVGSPAVDGDQVFVCSSVKDGSHSLGVVYALDRLYGDEIWVSEPLDGKLWVTPAVVDDVVYVSTFEGRVYSLDAATGALRDWRYESEFGFVSSPFVAGGVAYVASFDRSLTAIPLGADRPAWQFQADNWFWAAPVLSGDVMYAASLDGKLYALDVRTGVALWGTPYDAGEALASSPVLAGDSVVIANKKGDVHVVNALSGMGVRVPNPDNEKATTCNSEVVSAPCYHGGMVYVKAQNNVLHVVDPVSKSVAFTFSLKTE